MSKLMFSPHNKESLATLLRELADLAEKEKVWADSVNFSLNYWENDELDLKLIIGKTND